MKSYSIDELLSLDAAASDALEQILYKFVSPQDVVCGDRKDEDGDGDIQVQGTGDDTKIIVSGEPGPFVYIRACAVYLLRKFLPQLSDPDSSPSEAAMIARGELIYALSHVLFTLSGASLDMYRTVRQDDVDTITEELQSISSQEWIHATVARWQRCSADPRGLLILNLAGWWNWQTRMPYDIWVTSPKSGDENFENCWKDLIAPMTTTWTETSNVNVIKLWEIG